MVKIDFSDVKPLEPVPDGEYEATLTAAELVDKKQPGKYPYVKLEFTLAGSDPDGQSVEGRKLFRNSSLSPDSLWSFKQTMIGLGADPEDFEGDVDPEEMAKSLVGAECTLSVGTRTYTQNDVTRIVNDVKKVMGAGAFA